MLADEASPANQTTFRALQQNLFSLLQNCKTPQNLKQIHTHIVTNGFTQKNFLLVKLLSLYISYGHLQLAHQIINWVQSPSTTVWNQIIRGHLTSPTPRKSIELYNQMEANGIKPDGYTFSFVISACAKTGSFREGMQLHGRVLSRGISSNVFVQTNLVNLYAMVGGEVGFGNARRVFDEMPDRNVVTWNSLLAGHFRRGDVDGARRTFYEMPERNVVSWTTMIAGCAQNGRCRQALSLFHKMQRARIEFDQVTLVAALSACAELGDLKLGRCIHSYIHGNLNVAKEPVSVSLNNALVHMYSSCGLIKEAFEIFKRMPKKSTVSWTTMITGFAKQGCGEEALEVFHWMQRLGENDVRPDAITLIGLLCACSHAGFVDEGRYLFKCIQIWGIQPRIEHYGCMVDILSRAGLLEEAHELVQTMPMKPNDAIWGALLGGCRIYKNAELASDIAQKMVVELEPDQAAGYFVLLSNVYATTKKWQDVVNVRRMMAERGVRKPPGRSWVQINGIIHDFLVGDTSHKDANLIYRMLSDIKREAEWEACGPDESDALLCIEE